MELYEKKLSEKVVYEGIIVNIRRDEVELIDGSKAGREVVEHPGGVAVFAVDEEENVVLVRQYRYPVGDVILELPAGKLEPGEDPKECAIRELQEETGYLAGRLDYMGFSHSSPGIFMEKIHYYLARDLKKGAASPDEGEFVEVVTMPLQELRALAENNKLSDGKTLIGILKGTCMLNKSKD